ncbi:hypothetical protein N9X25_04780 [Verrucomicrobiales bacterium]|nr:hypothetical protein [Verrucomicrobiales bacterium]
MNDLNQLINRHLRHWHFAEHLHRAGFRSKIEKFPRKNVFVHEDSPISCKAQLTDQKFEGADISSKISNHALDGVEFVLPVAFFALDKLLVLLVVLRCELGKSSPAGQKIVVGIDGPLL